MQPTTFPRISGRQGQPIDLDASIYQAGVLADPYAIYKIELYKTSPVAYNLLETIPVAAPTSITYPDPLQREVLLTDGTVSQTPIPGKYHLITTIPPDWGAPDVYFDVWYFYPVNPCYGSQFGNPTVGTAYGTDGDPTAGTEPNAYDDCDLNDPILQRQLLTCCHRFWVYPDEWFCTDALQTLRFGFEPLDQKFRQPEIRPLEVGIMPLPLYDYNYNLATPIIPFLRPTITICTMNCEILVENQEMTLGLRQGSYRSNPWVCRYMVDTSRFLKGTYKYRITLALPDGTSRTSDDYILVVK